LTHFGKKVYSTLRKTISSLRELLYMTLALPSIPVKKQTPPVRTIEKLDLNLDFARASCPARTRLTHPHILFSPIHYEPKYAYPLLIWLHGTGGDERQLLRIMPIISIRNYVAVAPRGLPVEQSESLPTFDLSVSAILHRPKEQYDWILSEDHLATIEQRIFDCIAVAQERCFISDQRIFIAGFGTGGTTALRLATLYPECFAGVAAFGGDLPLDNRIFPSWQMPQPLSFLFGIDESTPDHVCQTMELFHTAGLTATIREYSDTKSLIPAMLQDLNRWMMQIVCQSGKGGFHEGSLQCRSKLIQ
jgi:phospholipase/carboxylesterase